MADFGTILLILAVVVGGALVLAPLKLFSIERHLRDILEELRALRRTMVGSK